MDMETRALLLWTFMFVFGAGGIALAARRGRRFRAVPGHRRGNVGLPAALLLQAIVWVGVVLAAAMLAMKHEPGEDPIVGLWPFGQAFLFAIAIFPCILAAGYWGFGSRKDAGAPEEDPAEAPPEEPEERPRRGHRYEIAVVTMTALTAIAAGFGWERLVLCLLLSLYAFIWIPGFGMIAFFMLLSWPIRIPGAVIFASIQYAILFRPLARYDREPRRWLLWLQLVFVGFYGACAVAYLLWTNGSWGAAGE